ncbi:glycosyltransferase family 2 protein [Spirosoma aureum]|uniref:Glycosyltransferase family 2 protein n=1 Tax=Spirosoma aureum TaxID=2692134 RepID=A0A6G9ANJ3_9BACT|nr:glycosyltransferase family A protein [Spirosoma aureum]QIP13906.1 glycosyltransferase family 2 protein [Spirosoma aureum]
MFSVVIPLYNKASYVEKAVESVLCQTFSDFELIVVNDGSTDSSVEKLARFTDDRLKLINQSNTGVSGARNKGVKHARFDYIAFLDADDWWHERFLEEMNALITQFSDAGLYGSNYFVVKNGVNTPAQVGVEAGFEMGYINYFKVYARTFWVPLNCSFVVVKKSVFEQEKGFNEHLRFGEDLDLWIRIALTHKVGYVNKFLANSNQDAETTNRALGTDKFWNKKEHVTFNISHLADQEQTQPNLKTLLDGLRVRSLVAYRLNDWYPEEVRAIMSRVDLSAQPLFYRFVYQWPRPIINVYFRAKQYGSYLKQMLLRRFYSYVHAR